jgi:hypothetical protein
MEWHSAGWKTDRKQSMDQLKRQSTGHTSKSDKSDEIHSQWISTLSEGVIVMYADGSKSNSGHTGAG